MGIVPTFDEFKHCLACLWLIAEDTAIEQLAFQGGEEALAESVIETIHDQAHRRRDSGFPTALVKSQGSALAALIGMMDVAFRVPSLGRHMQGIYHQDSLEVSGHW